MIEHYKFCILHMECIYVLLTLLKVMWLFPPPHSKNRLLFVIFFSWNFFFALLDLLSNGWLSLRYGISDHPRLAVESSCCYHNFNFLNFMIVIFLSILVHMIWVSWSSFPDYKIQLNICGTVHHAFISEIIQQDATIAFILRNGFTLHVE